MTWGEREDNRKKELRDMKIERWMVVNRKLDTVMYLFVVCWSLWYIAINGRIKIPFVIQVGLSSLFLCGFVVLIFFREKERAYLLVYCYLYWGEGLRKERAVLEVVGPLVSLRALKMRAKYLKWNGSHVQYTGTWSNIFLCVYLTQRTGIWK